MEQDMSTGIIKTKYLFYGPVGFAALIGGATLLPEPEAIAQSTSPTVISQTDGASRCAALTGRQFGQAVVESAADVAQGATLATAGPLAGLKAPANFCRVRARVRPVPGSQIVSEVWLPERWNGKLVGTGGGGYSGGLDSASLTLGKILTHGFAAAATDAGHPTSDGAKWALGEPEKVVDWGHRGNHLSTVFAKAVAADYFSKPVDKTYFEGCSNGGRDALMQARRYPNDYDGIVAGAPAADWTGMTSSFIWNWQVMFKTPGASLLHTKIKLINDAVLAKCDKLDGVKDGVLENPHQCRFDPAELRCKGADGPSCLNSSEVGALRKIYRGPRLRDGRRVFAGFPLGNEDIAENKQGWIDPSPAGTGAFGTEFYRWMVYGNPKWSPETFDLNRDYPLAVKRMGHIVDSHDPDLRAFVKKGGKLIVYHGWSDARIQADASLLYYDAVRRRVGPASAAKSVRLFMVPGMAHCVGGPGPSAFDMLSELDRWVENGTAPERVVATKYENAMLAYIGKPSKALRTRPICAWPKTAHHRGSGSTDDAANFVCK